MARPEDPIWGGQDPDKSHGAMARFALWIYQRTNDQCVEIGWLMAFSQSQHLLLYYIVSENL